MLVYVITSRYQATRAYVSGSNTNSGTITCQVWHRIPFRYFGSERSRSLETMTRILANVHRIPVIPSNPRAKLSYHHTIAVQQLPSTGSGPHLERISWPKSCDGPMHGMVDAPIACKTQEGHRSNSVADSVGKIPGPPSETRVNGAEILGHWGVDVQGKGPR